MEGPPHTVKIASVISCWMLTILLGSFFIPIVLLTFEPAYTELGMFLVTFGLFFVSGLVIAVPSLLVHITVCLLLNNRFPLAKYALLQNGVHVVHAIVAFAVIALVTRGEIAKMEVPLLGCCYTFAGLLIWNLSFYRAIRRTRQLPHA